MGSLKSAADFFARAPPSLCNSEHRLPSGHPPRASRSRFAWMLLTKANSRSFGALKRSHLMKLAMDEVSFERRGTEVRMRKASSWLRHEMPAWRSHDRIARRLVSRPSPGVRVFELRQPDRS